MPESTIWNIYVHGYGTFDFEGTRQEAEQAGDIKRRHEGSRSCRVWRKNLSWPSDRLTKSIVDLAIQGQGVPGPWLQERAEMLRQEETTDA